MIDNAPLSNAQRTDAEVVASHLEAGYGGKTVLHGVSLVVWPRELIAIIGPNGAGKSTLLKTMMGLLAATSGTVFLARTDITSLSTHQRVCMGLSYLSQGAEVFPSLTVEENLDVAVSALVSPKGRQGVEFAFGTWPSLERLRRTRAGLLSGGQRQMLAVAMAVARRSRVLLLDEPSAGLAPNVAQATLQRISELSRELHMTVLVAEQRVREVLQIADRVVVLHNGMVHTESCNPVELLESGRLEELVFPRDPSGQEGGVQ